MEPTWDRRMLEEPVVMPRNGPSPTSTGASMSDPNTNAYRPSSTTEQSLPRPDREAGDSLRMTVGSVSLELDGDSMVVSVGSSKLVLRDGCIELTAGEASICMAGDLVDLNHGALEVN